MSSEISKISDIRDFNPQTDTNFIMATFLKGLYYGAPWVSEIPKDVFMDNYKVIAENLINSPNTVVKIACLKEDPNVMLGYSILSADYKVIHWVFVKAAWRKQGIMRAIIPQYPIAVTHLTTVGKILLPKYKDCIFNPFLI
jgi:hypothetical protein